MTILPIPSKFIYWNLKKEFWNFSLRNGRWLYNQGSLYLGVYNAIPWLINDGESAHQNQRWAQPSAWKHLHGPPAKLWELPWGRTQAAFAENVHLLDLYCCWVPPTSVLLRAAFLHLVARLIAWLCLHGFVCAWDRVKEKRESCLRNLRAQYRAQHKRLWDELIHEHNCYFIRV